MTGTSKFEYIEKSHGATCGCLLAGGICSFREKTMSVEGVSNYSTIVYSVSPSLANGDGDDLQFHVLSPLGQPSTKWSC